MTTHTALHAATAGQFAFIRSLIASREINEALASRVADARAKAIASTLSSSEASSLIEALKDAPSISLQGMHVLPSGAIYKVQVAVHGSGREYAKRLIVEGGTASFEMERGAMRFLSASTRMTTEQAAHYGHLYGVCCNCGRTLTDERSIAQGYGPVCAQYFI